MLKNRSFGVASIVAGIVLNNFAYLVDVLRGTHDGFIYLGDKGVVAALAGIGAILLGMFVLLRTPEQKAG